MLKILSFFLHGKCLFLRFSLLLLINKKRASHFRRETANENKQKFIFNSSLIRQICIGIVVNRALQSFQGGSVEITRTIHIKIDTLSIYIYIILYIVNGLIQ